MRRAAHERAPIPATSRGESLTSSETARAIRTASTVANRGRRESDPREDRQRGGDDQRRVAGGDKPVPQRADRRCAMSPSTSRGPSSSARVTWLEPPSAASIPTTATPIRRRRLPPGQVPCGQRNGSQPQPQEEVAGREDQDAAAVCSGKARADGDEHEQRDRDEEPPAGQCCAEEPGNEEQGLDLVLESVEATAVLRPRADRRERARLGRPGQHEQVEREDREQGDSERRRRAVIAARTMPRGP